jgi:V/A-type H+-transporting ATPase subunit E
MSVQLKELIDRIKKEGVQEAEGLAAQVREKAQEEAERIVSDAKRNAQSIVDKAEAEARQFEEAAKESLRQAGRDLLLNVKKALTELLEGILKREIREALDREFLEQALMTLIKNWDQKEGRAIEVQLPEKQQKELTDFLLKQLAKELKTGVEIKPSQRIESGFKISEKDAFYDFSDKGLTEFLMEFLNPRVAEALKGKEG